MNMSREEHDRSMMNAEALVDSMNTWITSLDTSGLGALRSLLKLIIQDKRSIMYNLGRVELMLEQRGVCMCGETHSIEEAELMGSGHKPTIETRVPERFVTGPVSDYVYDRSTGQFIPPPCDGGLVPESPSGLLSDDEAKKILAAVNSFGKGTAAWVQPELDLMNDEGGEGEASPAENMIANAEIWGVRFVDPETLTGKVECIQCGSEYQSLADRMVREPGFAGCHFCHLKSRLG